MPYSVIHINNCQRCREGSAMKSTILPSVLLGSFKLRFLHSMTLRIFFLKVWVSPKKSLCFVCPFRRSFGLQKGSAPGSSILFPRIFRQHCTFWPPKCLFHDEKGWVEMTPKSTGNEKSAESGIRVCGVMWYGNHPQIWEIANIPKEKIIKKILLCLNKLSI